MKYFSYLINKLNSVKCDEAMTNFGIHLLKMNIWSTFPLHRIKVNISF